MRIKTFVGPGFAENAYLVWREGSKNAVVIDPGADAAAMVAEIQSQQLTLDAILLTHAHLDHIEGVAALKRHSGAPIYLHSDDRFLYDNAAVQGAQFGIDLEKLPDVDNMLEDEQRLQFAGIEFQVAHVPGHSPGHVMLFVEDEGVAFVGDVVFQSSIGRTDLPGGSFQVLMQSIREKVMTLPDETKLYSGHGPPTTIAAERTNNPFIAPMYGGGAFG